MRITSVTTCETCLHRDICGRSKEYQRGFVRLHNQLEQGLFGDTLMLTARCKYYILEEGRDWHRRDESQKS